MAARRPNVLIVMADHGGMPGERGPPLLFDLEAVPQGLDNLAGKPWHTTEERAILDV